jgi:hypothetical protein
VIDLQTIPRPGDRWLSCPPYLLIAHVIDVDESAEPPFVTYELQDEDGDLLERVDHAILDDGWWRAFQPMACRFG